MQMSKHLTARMIVTGALLLLVSIVVAGCTSSTPTSAPVATTEPTSAPAPEVAGDPVRGGLLYDEWWAVIGADEPATDQPLWKTQSANTLTGSDTWRCKECHGWDYKGVDGAYGAGSHKTGFVGIFDSRSKTASEILAALKGSTNPDHDFSTVMDEQDLIDLALFIAQAQIDDVALVNADGTAKGDTAQGKEKFESVCTYCHGPDGNAINFGTITEPEFLGHVAGDNPWELVHKVRFGQPGWPMPSAISNQWTDQDVANVLAYVQTLPTTPAASGGGQLYDAWFEVLGVEPPAGDQPLWKTQTTNKTTGADTWSCAECHGFDYMGKDGINGSGEHQTGFPGILSAASMSTEELTAWLTGKKNADHDFSKLMGGAEIGALVTFIQKEAVDTSPYINADGTANGDPARGKAKFDKTCAACHGLDGKKINFGAESGENEYLGNVATDEAWKFFHVDGVGEPAQPMPSAIGLGWSLEDRANVLAYAQTLPTK
jgi:thiosulfate dehydrogenase